MQTVLTRPPVPRTSDERWNAPPHVEVWLVGGFHRRDDKKDWTLAGADGRPQRWIGLARRFPFDREGCGAARAAADALAAAYGPGHIAFVARIVVMQVPGEPEEVVAAWTLEGPEPVPVSYPFDPPAA